MLSKYISISSEILGEYLLMLHNISKNKKINEKKVDFRILNEFVIREQCNIYQCHQSLLEKDDEDYSPTYKTVHTKIHELAALELIERDKTKSVDHGATEYHLTSFGVYYVIKNHYNKLTELSIIKSNNSDKLFEIFLYPFISKETVFKMEDHYIQFSIFAYLFTICKAIDRLLGIMKEIEYEGGVKDIMATNLDLEEIFSSAVKDKNRPSLDLSSTFFFDYLESNHGIKWYDHNSIQIEKESEFRFRIVDDTRELVFEFNDNYDGDDKHYATLYDEKGNTIVKLKASYWDWGIFNIYELIPMCVTEFLLELLSDKSTYKNIFEETDIPVHELCWKIIHYLFSETNSYLDKIKKDKLSILANDPHFKKCIQEVENDTKIKIKKFKDLIN